MIQVNSGLMIKVYYLIPPKKHHWHILGYIPLPTYSTNPTHTLIMDASPWDRRTWMILNLGRDGIYMDLCYV